MEHVATRFSDRAFEYDQLSRQGMLALYCQTHKASGVCYFEVVRLRVRPSHTWPNGMTTPEHEAYPSPESWGRDGWTFSRLDTAQAKLAALVLRGTAMSG